MAELKLGNIKPVGADNVVVEGKYVKGGYVVVATIEERDALKGANGENIVEGSLCFCQADSKFYQYNGTSWIEQTQAATVASNLNTHVNTKTGNPHNVTKANVGLGSVVNTGDSATPVEGGTTKFTTGGAYTELNKKVDKVSGKGLSTNDYTTAEKNKLAGIAEGANKTIIDSSLSSTSTNPVQNKVVKGALDAKANASDLSSHTESTTVHITSDERTNWNAAKTHADSAHAPSNAEKNQNAFSNVAVSGQTTVSADTTTDTLTLVAGNNVTITTDATNDKVTIAAKDTVYTHPTHTAKSSGLYKITVDNEGHVSDTTAVQKSDITALGIPGQDTNTHNSHAIISGKKSDGTTDIKGTASATDITLGDSGVTAGEYGPTSNQTPAYGGTFNVPDIKVNAKGIVTSVTNRTVKIPASDNTDTGATSIEVTGSGNAVTAASYDATNRKITLTKGATYNNYSLPAAGSSLGGVKTGGDVTISSGVITVNDDSHNHVIGNIDGLQDALDAKADDHDHPYVPTSEKGAANGVATLDAGGKVPTAQLPSYVDDVLEYSAKSAFPATGETGKIYVDTTANKTYRWSGSTYTEISASLALGETSSTAYRGDYGKLAYNHSQATSGNPHGVTKSDIGLSNVENKSSATIRSELTQVDVLDALGYTPVDGSDLTNLYEEIQGSKNDDRAHTQTAGQWTLGGLYNWVLDVETAANAAPYVYGDGGIDGTPSYISTTRNTDAGHTEVTLTDQAKDSLAHADVAYSHSQTAHAPSNAQPNQNAFSNIKVGSTTIAADTTTDTLELVGSNVTVTPDATNDKVTIGITKDNVVSALGYTPPTSDTKYTHPNSGVTAGTYKSVTVNAQGHVTSGSNPTTLAEYGITDAASKNHAHQKYDEVVRYNLHPAAADDNFSYCELTKDTCYIEYMCNEHVHEAISDTIVVPRLSHDGLLVTHIGHTDYVNSCVFNNDAKVVILPDSITTIGAYAFDSCDALGTIAIPDSVRYIEDAAFANCTVLNCLTFGKNSELVSIGERAFLFCRGLTSVVIPKRVTSIGAEAFACCTNLKKVILEGTYTSINLGLGAFGQCESLTDVYLAGPPPVDMDDLYDLFDNQRSITFHFNYSDDFANIADRINKAENIPKAGSTVAGLVKVSSVNNTAVSVNGESTTAGRYYPIELNSDGKIIVNVPWTNTTYSVANATTPGLVKPVSVITKPSLNSVTTTAGKYYQVQMSSDGNMFVNVPWTAYTHPTTAGNKHIPSGGSSGQILKYSSSGTAVWGSVPAATSSSLGGVKISFNATSGVLTITTT